MSRTEFIFKGKKKSLIKRGNKSFIETDATIYTTALNSFSGTNGAISH